MIGIIGIKIGMLHHFNSFNSIKSITLIKLFSGYIFEKTAATIKIGFNLLSKHAKQLTKNYLGIFLKLNSLPYNYIKEYKITEISKKYSVGEYIDSKFFLKMPFVNITGISNGKGFSGNIKRNNFKRGPKSHGSKHLRLQGSLGAGTTPGRVFPGKKMSGHLGNQQNTVKNVKIHSVNDDFLLVYGSTPGKPDSILKIK